MEASFYVAIGQTQRQVDAWSTFRLPFEPRGDALILRSELAAALTLLAPGSLCHARYTSPSRQLVDLENVLTYNVGNLAAFARIATRRVVLERSYADSPTCPKPLSAPPLHHHRYTVLANVGPLALVWIWNQTILTFDRMAIPGPHTTEAWWACRRSDRTLHHEGVRIGLYGLRIRVPRGAFTSGLVSGMKPLIDGVISAFSCQDGALNELAVSSVAADLDQPVAAITAELRDTSTAVLGPRSLLRLRANRPHWNPQDDPLVLLDLSYHDDGYPYITGELGTVTGDES